MRKLSKKTQYCRNESENWGIFGYEQLVCRRTHRLVQSQQKRPALEGRKGPV